MYWMYIVEYHPEETPAGLDPWEFRIGMEKALLPKGSRSGSGRPCRRRPRTCSRPRWASPPAASPGAAPRRGGSWCTGGEHPHELDLCRRYTAVVGFQPPNGLELMEKHVQAFPKVSADLEAVQRHRQDPVAAHHPGGLFRTR